MKEETIALVAEYMRGNPRPLISAAGTAVSTVDAEQEALELYATLDYAEQAVKYIKKTMPLDHQISGFNGLEISIQCSCANHPPQTVPVRGNMAWLPKNKTWHPWPSLFAVNPAVKVKECHLCEEERKNTSIIYKPVCRYHQTILLGADLACPECKTGPSLFALDGRSITLVNRGPATALYDCPMHEEYSVGYRARSYGCPACASYREIVAYGSTLPRNNGDELRRVKTVAEKHVAKYLRKAKRHERVNPHKVAMIDALVKRCFDPNNNMHLLHIFPSEAFINGEWLLDHQKHFAFSESAQEYLMPRPQDLIDPIGGQKAVLMNEAIVLCDSQWRTAHWSRHKEFV